MNHFLLAPLKATFAACLLATTAAAVAQASQSYQLRVPARGLTLSPAPAAPAEPVSPPAPPPTVATAALSVSTISFGSVSLGQSPAQTGTLANTGTAPLSFSSAPELVGDSAFKLTSNCGTTLQPGQTCTYQVTYTPTVVASATGSVQFSSNASPAISPVSLSGTAQFTGVASRFDLSKRGGYSGTVSSPDAGRTVVFTGGLQGVPGLAPLPTFGKWYWEVQQVSGTSIVGAGTLPITNHIGTPGVGPAYPISCGSYGNSVIKGSSPTVSLQSAGATGTGAVYGFAYDATIRRLSFYRGTTYLGQCTFSDTSQLYVVATNGSSASGSSARANLQPSEMSFSPPSGFLAGLPQ